MFTSEEKAMLIDRIRTLPDELEALVSGLSEAQLKTVTIPGEWTVQQIVHHLADSHMNSVIRLKLILTSEQPTLVGYDQEVWAEMPDTQDVPIAASLAILRGLHARWTVLFESITPEQWTRTGHHTERGEVPAYDFLTTYADHCNIHLDQIRRVLAAAQ